MLTRTQTVKLFKTFKRFEESVSILLGIFALAIIAYILLRATGLTDQFKIIWETFLR